MTSFAHPMADTQKSKPHGTCGCAGSCAGCGHCASKKPVVVRELLQNGASRVAASPGIVSIENDLARFIDHTLLKPDASREEIIQLCREAGTFRFASVCVNPCWVAEARRELAGSEVMVCSVVGFPFGATLSASKAFEAQQAVLYGASEIDMVINIGWAKDKEWRKVFEDIALVVQCVPRTPVKVILETGLLDLEAKVAVCALAKEAGAAFVKTSTGFSKSGASLADVQLMRRVVGAELGVKAAGGIGDAAQARAMLDAGATRIGASASVKIVTQSS